MSSFGGTASERQPGRTCPLSYRYSPSTLARDAELQAETLYIAGGVYGNPYALARILEIAHDDPCRGVLVFNGDFNWFNTDAYDFAAINDLVMRNIALRGNVETELAHDDIGAGCGCAYPQKVSDEEVDRSNAILARLRETARAAPTLRKQLGALPMHMVVEVAGIRIAIVHGDAESLAGWAYSEHELRRPEGIRRLLSHIAAARVRVIASSHTCLPVALDFETPAGRCALFNNGAAGMPNFRGTRYGLVTRIASRPAANALYGTRIGAAYVDAVAVDYDHARWIERFRASWPEGSPAHLSYFERIVEGPNYNPAAAVRAL